MTYWVAWYISRDSTGNKSELFGIMTTKLNGKQKASVFAFCEPRILSEEAKSIPPSLYDFSFLGHDFEPSSEEKSIRKKHFLIKEQ